MGDWLVAASFAPQPGRYRSTGNACIPSSIRGALPSIMALLI
jgi:hypothetical protein